MTAKSLLTRLLALFRCVPAYIFGVAIGLVLCAGSVPVAAQVDQGTIAGTVVDTTNGAIPGAHVTIINNATQFMLKIASDSSGFFVSPSVKIGTYTVEASAKDFKTTVQEHVVVEIGARANLVLTLSPGDVTQTVTVTAPPPLLQTESGATGQVLSTQSINNIPLNGRNWVFIAQLAPGAVPTAGNSRGWGNGDFSANGQQSGQNDFILDGVDDDINLLDMMSGASYVVRPPPDALAEFAVETGNYSAQFGHSAGTVINANTKSGTNQIHGDLWEYFRNGALDAKSFSALTVPEYHENQFGATLGLPIIKNKLFFFGDTESNRIVNGEPTTVTVPTALMRQGNFSELLETNLTGDAKPVTLYEPNSGGAIPLTCNGEQNVFCSSQIDSVAKNILNLYPLPNTNGGDTYDNYTVNEKQVNNTFQWTTRFDWDPTEKDQAYTRYSYLHVYGSSPGPLGNTLDGSAAFDTGAENFLTGGYMASETHIFSPTLTNEVRFGFNWGAFSYLQSNYNTDLSASLGFGGIPFGSGWPDDGGLPYTTVSGINGFGTHSYDPAVESQNVYEILDNLTKILGNQVLKFGIDLQNIRASMLEPTYGHGAYSFTGLYTSYLNESYTGSGVADFLSDQIDAAEISNEENFEDSRWYRSAYFQDDWRINKRLTLNLGMRYDYYQPFKENTGYQAAYHITGPLSVGKGEAVLEMPMSAEKIALSAGFLSNLAADNISLEYVSNPRLIESQFTNFAPRFGFAYSTSPKTVIHGGFGIFYGGLESEGGGPNFGFSYPFQYTQDYVAPSCALDDCPSTGFTLENGFSTQLANGIAASVTSPTLIGSDPEAKTPYTMDYNLTVQRSITNNIVATVAYVGNEARHIEVSADPNSAEALENPSLSIQSARPFPAFVGTSYTRYGAVSTYNGLQATIEKRYSDGLQFLADYTWSHALDDAPFELGGYGSAGNGGGFRNPNLIPIIDDYANADIDTRQRFNLTAFYDLPFGRDRAHLNHGGPVSMLAGDWSANLTFSAQSGNPIAITPDITTAAGGSNSYAMLVSNPFAAGGTPPSSNSGITCAQRTKTSTHWYNPCAFANPLPGSDIPTSGTGSQITGVAQVMSYLGGRRNQITGPGYNRVDMSIFKNFTTFKGQTVQFRTDVFNLFNTPAYGNPSVLSDASSGGEITSTRDEMNFAPDARFFQFALKYVF